MKKIIEYLVDHLYHVTEWDWVAILVSLTSLGIAITSMIIAKRTLKSQKQTEINTTPIIKPSIQEFLLKEVLVKAFDSYMRLVSMKSLYDKAKYNVYLSEEKLMEMKIDTRVIHVELFYTDEEKYRCIQGLLNVIEAFNSNIDVCVTHFKNSHINVSLLEKETARLIELTLNIVLIWDKVMTLVYGYNVIMKKAVLDIIVKRMSSNLDSEESMEKLFEKDNVFSFFYDTPEEKNRLLLFMNNYASQVTSDFSSSLIER